MIRGYKEQKLGFSQMQIQQKIPHYEDFQTSKVQFFSTSSILDQISLDAEVINQSQKMIQHEVNMIFLALQKELVSVSTQQTQQRLQKIINRANILYHSTISEFLEHQKRLNFQPKKDILKEQQKVKQLLENYQSYQKDTISYEEFYRLYGIQKIQPKEQEQIVRNMQKRAQNVERIGFEFVQKVEINYTERLRNFKQDSSRLNAHHNNKIAQSDIKSPQKATLIESQYTNVDLLIQEINKLKHENRQLNHEIYLLKARVNAKDQEHSANLLSERKMFSERLQNITKLKLQSVQDKLWETESKNANDQMSQLKNHARRHPSSQLSVLLKELNQLSHRLAKEMALNSSYLEKIHSFTSQIERLQMQNSNLKEQVGKSEKSTVKNYSMLSFHQNDIQNELNSFHKTKQNQILIHQVQLLQRELQSQRQKTYTLTNNFTQQKNEEVSKLRTEIQKRKHEIQSLIFQLDKLKVENVVIQENYQNLLSKNKILKIAANQTKQELQNIKTSKLTTKQNGFQKTGLSFHPQKSRQLTISSPFKSTPLSKSQQITRPKKIKIDPYISDVLEGFVYFQCLEREFKYRYLRACLRSKQLLYKKNGFEVGVISKTHYDSTEGNLKIGFVLYLTNSSEESINDVKLTMISSNSRNEVKSINQKEKYSLKPGDQAKVYFEVSVWSYPLGSISIVFQGLNEQLRLLLPLSVIKLFNLKKAPLNKDDMKHNSSQMAIKCESRVIKSFDFLIESLTDSKPLLKELRQIGLVGNHEQTGTKVKMWLEYDYEKEILQVWYFKEIGSLDLVDYFMKTLKFVIEKEKK